MNLYLGAILTLFNYFLLKKRQEYGIVLFCILLVVSPVIWVGSISLAYSYFFWPFLTLWYFSHSYKSRGITQIIWFMMLSLMWSVIISIFTYSLGIADKINYIAIIGTFKWICIIAIISRQLIVKEKLIEILSVILIINLIVCFLELLLFNLLSPSNTIQLWMQLYGTIGNTGSLEAVSELDHVGRLHGTFPSSSYLGSLSMLGIGIFLVNYFKTKSWASIFMLSVSMVCGLCSSSKRFFLGGVVIALLCLVIKHFWIKSNKPDYKLPVIIFMSVIILLIMYSFLSQYLGLDYYLDFLIQGNFSGALETRFGEDGAVQDMRTYNARYWLTGLGEVTIKDVGVTDSQFYVTIFKTGIFGMCCHLCILAKLAKNTINIRNCYATVVVFCIMFEFVISTLFYIFGS